MSKPFYGLFGPKCGAKEKEAAVAASAGGPAADGNA
jgi:hypothetical protein